MRVRFCVALLALALAACSKRLELPVHQIQVPTPSDWQAADTEPVRTGEGWWEYLGDSKLDSVIRKALDCNHSLQAASERIETAAQERIVAGAADVPDLSVGANRLRQRQNFVGLPFPGLSDRVLSNSFTSSGMSFNVSWEADIWNRIAADKLAADATVAAREADLQAARLSISGQVAKAWFATVESERQIELARVILSHAESVLERTRERYRAGSRPATDVRLAEADVQRARVTVIQREQARDAFVRQVEVLACEYPAGERAIAATIPELPHAVPAGLPSELVFRRPDLVAAERTVLSSDARIVQARAALRPSLSLTGVVGTSSNTVLDLVNPSLQIWNYALGVAQPIFNRGRLKANVRAAEARAREAASSYEDRVWNAYREVETAMAAERTLRDQENALREVLRSNEKATELARDRFGAAMGDAFAVLNLRRTLLDIESSIVGLQAARIENRIDLHLALGGSFPDGQTAGDPVGPND